MKKDGFSWVAWLFVIGGLCLVVVIHIPLYQWARENVAARRAAEASATDASAMTTDQAAWTNKPVDTNQPVFEWPFPLVDTNTSAGTNKAAEAVKGGDDYGG